MGHKGKFMNVVYLEENHLYRHDPVLKGEGSREKEKLKQKIQ